LVDNTKFVSFVYYINISIVSEFHGVINTNIYVIGLAPRKLFEKLYTLYLECESVVTFINNK